MTPTERIICIVAIIVGINLAGRLLGHGIYWLFIARKRGPENG